MNEQELSFVEKQFKKIGLTDAFTAELVDKMKSGERQIVHPFTKMYDGDEAKASFHLKKGESSNLYFLNKYEVIVRKEGQTNEVSREFYLNNFKRLASEENKFQDKHYTTFTFKAAFNYLSGRPVFNTYQNQSGDQYKSWDLLNLKKILPNGKMEEKHYHENYGYDLERVLKNYSIKELAAPDYKERLLQSLQRGNLQSVTFVGKDGKAEKMFISPDIPLGALKVYDENKTRIATPVLVEKGFIGNEFAEKIKLQIEKITQNKRQSEKQDNTESKQKQDKLVKEEGKPGQEIKRPRQSLKGNKSNNRDKDGPDSENNLGKQERKPRQKIH